MARDCSTFKSGSVDLYQCQLANANEELNSLISNRDSLCLSSAQWDDLCSRQECNQTAIDTANTRRNQCAAANTAVSNKQTEINGIQANLGIAKTQFDIEANKSPAQKALEAAAKAKQKNYFIALIAAIIIILVVVILWFRSKRK